ncbi:hypothetical protein BU16DRAFT_560682 [Lophium mytilinum]|uniref:F-box domain-containing protein n=1 Tax=Lophium mytilinum TaxID=390894 RepID=A0A6A6QV91_9PEZI|nr:hypothetical protein BU16DRAFT_560682 [Lophium mytilinum]
MAFNLLPIELNQEIAHYIDSDKDLCAFAATCQETRNAVQSDGGSFWNRRFRSRFALEPGRHDNEVLRKKYQRRRKWLRRMSSISFKYGHGKREVKSMAVITELINESFSGQVLYDEHGRRTCRNLDELSRFIETSTTLSKINEVSLPRYTSGTGVAGSYNWTLAAIQLMYSHVLFDNSRIWNEVYNFEHSQQMAYANAIEQPIFIGLDRQLINMEFILHLMNFFRHHMMHKDESHALYEAYKELSAVQKPSAWDRKLKNHDQHIGNDWRGTYAYLEPQEVIAIRAITDGTNKKKKNTIFIDKNVDGSTGECPIQSLHLDPVGMRSTDSDDSSTDGDKKPILKSSTLPPNMLNMFSSILKAHPTPKEARTRAQHRTRSTTPPRKPQPISIEGEGKDDGTFYASGWMSDVPAQENIEGWKRMSFIKYYTDSFGNVDQGALWGYEGVVLPGGKLCLGRWWAVEQEADEEWEEDDELYSGPFILWNVQAKTAPKEA